MKSLVNEKQNVSIGEFIIDIEKILIKELYLSKCITSCELLCFYDEDYLIKVFFEKIIKRNNLLKDKFAFENYILNNAYMAFGSGAYFANQIFTKKNPEIDAAEIEYIIESLNDSDYITFGLSKIGIIGNSKNFHVILSAIQNSLKKIFLKYSKELNSENYIINMMELYFDAGVTIAHRCFKHK